MKCCCDAGFVNRLLTKASIDAALEKLSERAMKIGVPAGSTALTALDDWLGKKHQKMVIHFDEMIELCSGGDASRLTHLLNRLRGLKNIYALVDLHYVDDYEASLGPVLADTAVYFVKNLTREELENYLLRIQKSGGQVPASTDSIYAQTGGHPLLVNAVLTARAEDEDRPRSRGEKSPEEQNADWAYANFWRFGFSDEGRALVKRIAGGERIAASESANGLLKGALAMGWIRITEDRYEIVGTMFENFIRRQ